MTLHDLEIETLTGDRTTLGALAKGKATLIVNVASKCGLTPQYAGLEAMHEDLAAKGFTVIVVPCNQFKGQVREIIRGDVVSDVDVQTPWGVVTSVITTRSVDELGLVVGSDVVALVKSTEVSIAKL